VKFKIKKAKFKNKNQSVLAGRRVRPEKILNFGFLVFN
jgi:hypothetical protein